MPFLSHQSIEGLLKDMYSASMSQFEKVYLSVLWTDSHCELECKFIMPKKQSNQQ